MYPPGASSGPDRTLLQKAAGKQRELALSAGGGVKKGSARGVEGKTRLWAPKKGKLVEAAALVKGKTEKAGLGGVGLACIKTGKELDWMALH